MAIAIIIIVYLLWIGDIIEHAKSNKSNLLATSALITLVSWQVATPWGYCYALS
jgi:hypothetical protein